jgi:FkbM family methyltransferase
MDPLIVLPKWSRRLAREYLEHRGFRPAFDRQNVDAVWIDVGAHLGQITLDAALNNPRLLVFAFEPNWALARQIMARAANFVVLPMAVSDRDGIAEFFISSSDGSSSLVRMEESGLSHWRELDLTVQSTALVPTIRLDTFMRLCDLARIDYLKVDAEGTDLMVVQSAGNRLEDIGEIKLEVDVAPDRLYQGAPSRAHVVDFMLSRGFKLTDSEVQNGGRQENLTFVKASAVMGKPGR